MRYYIKSLLVVFASCLSVMLYGQLDPNDRNIQATSAFNPAIIAEGETGELEINWVNISAPFSNIPTGQAFIQVQVPTVFYNITGAPTGVGADLFNWSDLGNGIWYGVTNQDIGLAVGGPIVFPVIGLSNTGGAPQLTTITTNVFVPLNDWELNNNTPTSGLVVPIVLTKFDVESRDCSSATISWQTANEVNNAGFTIERSTDLSKGFEQIEYMTVTDPNSAILKDYTFEDDLKDLQIKGEVYYRLIQTDLDGTESSFDIAVLTLDCAPDVSFSLYPNPAVKTISLDIEGDISTVSNYIITNDLNQVVLENPIDNGLTDLDVTGLTAGVYYMTLFDTENNKISSKKFIKLQ